MNNVINANEKIKAALIKRGESKVLMPKTTKIFFVDFRKRILLSETVISNKRVA